MAANKWLKVHLLLSEYKFEQDYKWRQQVTINTLLS